VQAHLPLAHACELPQSTQAVPPVPHAVAEVPLTHLPPASQQPLEQVVAPQVWGTGSHLPLLHASVAAQALQAAPPAPQAAFDWPATQAPLPSQQPLGQVEGPQATVVQAWSTQSSPFWQALHSTPPLPHTAGLFPGRQTPV